MTDAWLTQDLDTTVDRLRRRLAEQADADGALDVAYREVDSPLGRLLLAATPAGLVRVGLPVLATEDLLQELATRVSPRVLHAPARLDAPARELESYFAGRLTRFETPLDLRLSTGFRKEVLVHLAQVPYGERWTYTELATVSGRPRAVRAAASACATNPLPLVVPCHRILRSDGSLGGYLGGLPAKEALLHLEDPAWRPRRDSNAQPAD